MKNIFDKISFYKDFYISKLVFFIKTRLLCNYVLVKTSSKFKVKLPDLSCDDLDLSCSELYRDDVYNFYSVLKSNFSPYYLSMLRKNISSLTISELSGKEKKSLYGVYDLYDNSIRLCKEDFKDTFPHEMFHMATTKINKFFLSCGFHFSNDEFDLGKAINEGYSEILSYRYFGSDISSSLYIDDVNNCWFLEKIVGKELMEKFYMSSDLFGLIQELSKYSSRADTVRFICYSDYILECKDKVSSAKNNHSKSKAISKNKKKIFTSECFYNQLFDNNVYLTLLSLNKNKGKKISVMDFKKRVCFDKDYYNYKKYKNLYLDCFSLFNFQDSVNMSWHVEYLKKIFDLIGYDKLSDICFVDGIGKFVEELSKYINKEAVIEFINLFETVSHNSYFALKNKTFKNKFNEFYDRFSSSFNKDKNKTFKL